METVPMQIIRDPCSTLLNLPIEEWKPRPARPHGGGAALLNLPIEEWKLRGARAGAARPSALESSY